MSIWTKNVKRTGKMSKGTTDLKNAEQVDGQKLRSNLNDRTNCDDSHGRSDTLVGS